MKRVRRTENRIDFPIGGRNCDTWKRDAIESNEIKISVAIS